MEYLSVNENDLEINKNDDYVFTDAVTNMKQRLYDKIYKVYEYDRLLLLNELHDNFGQSLAAIKSFSSGIKNNVTEKGDVLELADMSSVAADDLYKSSYDLMLSLRSGFIEKDSLLGCVQECVNNCRLSQRGISTEYELDFCLKLYDTFLRVVMLRVIQDVIFSLVRSFSPLNFKIICKQVPGNDLSQSKKDQVIIEIQCLSDNNLDGNDSSFDQVFIHVSEYLKLFDAEFNLSLNVNTVSISTILDVGDFALGNQQ